MQRDMASLAITSIFSVLADIVLVFFIMTFSPIQESMENAGGFGEVLLNDGVNPTLFIGLGILSTAMACQHSAFIVSGSLENKTMTRWSMVTGFSITLSAILCLILGICGYLGFLDETQGDVLNNFDQDSIVANGARFLLAITMFFTYPMESFVARHVMVQLMHGGDLDGKDDPNHSGVDGDEAGGYLCLNRRQTWTMSIYIMTLIPALIVDDLGPVLSITGSLGGGCIGKCIDTLSMIHWEIFLAYTIYCHCFPNFIKKITAYMAPGLCYIAVNGGEFLGFARELLRKKKNKSNSGVTEADLPVDGNSDREISNYSSDEIEAGCKPLWWYIFGFPLWCSIASYGESNMRDRISREGNNTVTPQDVNEEDILIPNGKEFCIAIFFVIFGVVAVIAGIGSNIYVQLG